MFWFMSVRKMPLSAPRIDLWQQKPAQEGLLTVSACWLWWVRRPTPQTAGWGRSLSYTLSAGSAWMGGQVNKVKNINSACLRLWEREETQPADQLFPSCSTRNNYVFHEAVNKAFVGTQSRAYPFLSYFLKAGNAASGSSSCETEEQNVAFKNNIISSLTQNTAIRRAFVSQSEVNIPGLCTVGWKKHGHLPLFWDLQRNQSLKQQHHHYLHLYLCIVE